MSVNEQNVLWEAVRLPLFVLKIVTAVGSPYRTEVLAEVCAAAAYTRNFLQARHAANPRTGLLAYGHGQGLPNYLHQW